MYNKIERIHSLDSLRAIMMLLGLVLHSTETYLVQDNEPWPKDFLYTSSFLNYLEYLIHMFRMPIFFLVAGFFGALLFYQKGSINMVKNRISRIAFPFIVFLFLLYPITLFSLDYSKAVFSGDNDAFGNTLSNFSDFFPETTLHLWFLYYLIMITFVMVLLALLFKKTPNLTKKIHQSFSWIFQRPFMRIIFLAISTFVLLVILWSLSGPTPLAFSPNFEAFIFYFFFYSVGWILFKCMDLLDSFMKYDWLNVIIAIILFTVAYIFSNDLDDILKGVLSAFMISLFVFGITGLFIRYFSSHSQRIRYISDSSYWIYLIHIPFTIIIPGLIANLELHAIGKFLITLILTTIISIASYHYLVRSTFIGKFLNGRMYSIK